jgi:hypothetical protein
LARPAWPCLPVAIRGALFVVMDVVAGTLGPIVAAAAVGGFCGSL